MGKTKDGLHDDGQLIAFLVAAHTDPMLVKRLVARLAPHDVYLHVDAKTPLSQDWQSTGAQIISPRVPVYWAGYSQVEATMALIRTALASGKTYSKLVLLSGACYPIVPVETIARAFAADGGHNHIRYVDMRGAAHLPTLIGRRYRRDGILSWRLTARFRALLLIEKVLRKVYHWTIGRLDDPWTFDMTPFHGSSWWAMSPEAARFAIAEIERQPKLVAKYRRSFASDEQIFHTIIGNSKYAARSTGQIPFTGRGVWKTANLHLIDPSLTRWFGIEDLEEIRSSPFYFVRKVSTLQSSALLDALDEIATNETVALSTAAVGKIQP